MFLAKIAAMYRSSVFMRAFSWRFFDLYVTYEELYRNPHLMRISRKWIIENVISLALALLVVFAIRSSVVEAFKIPSGSMIPTLLVGDHIFVNKFAYGFKLPFSDWVTDEPTYLVKRDPPKRGEIIVFLFPNRREETIYYIKRVIGTPGDIVEVKDKQIYVNNKPMPQTPIVGDRAQELFKSLDAARFGSSALELYDEDLGNVNHVTMVDRNAYMNGNYGPITVPADSLFVMGDNRDFSSDSRSWGFVPLKNVKGRAMIIWLSIWLDEFTFRPSRIGTVLR
jgi:signal peptidase I